MRRIALAILAALAAAASLRADPGAGSVPGADCRLVVIIVVDQLPGAYFSSLSDLYGAGGFRRLMAGGAWFTNCHYGHGVTITGPGHATIVTGAAPAAHGIVGNAFIDQSSADARKVGCIEDAAAAVIGPVVSSISGASPRWLACRTLGDQMKARDPRSKVVACSLKARSAVLMGGHRADGAFWWEHNAQSGAFVTSTYYGTSLPPWLAELNESGTCQNWTTALWTRLLDAETYQARCGSDDAAYEMGAVLGVGNGFPHPYVGGSDPYAALMTSPAGNELVLQVAGKLLDAYALGQRGGASDLLCISLSSNDEVGHAYGPQSQEFMDITLRTDQQLAGFLSSLDARIGLQHCLIVLTSDHGAVAMPEFSLQKGLAAGRFDPIELGQRFEARLSAVLGTPPDGRTYVQLVQMPWMYVNEQLVVERGGDAQALRRALDDFAAAEPGLASIFLAADIVKPDFVRDDLTRRVRRSYFAGRSGQVYLHTKRYWHYDLREAGHGSAHDYDTHVPLLMLGPGIRAGWYTAEATPADVVPTLAHLLGVEPPEGADGRVLTEALQSP